MVFRQTIEELKTRPHHERRSFALVIAGIVVAVLFLIWSVFFFSGLHVQPPQNLPTIVTATSSAS